MGGGLATHEYQCPRKSRGCRKDLLRGLPFSLTQKPKKKIQKKRTYPRRAENDGGGNQLIQAEPENVGGGNQLTHDELEISALRTNFIHAEPKTSAVGTNSSTPSRKCRR